jgi:hypothetical protein
VTPAEKAWYECHVQFMTNESLLSAVRNHTSTINNFHKTNMVSNHCGLMKGKRGHEGPDRGWKYSPALSFTSVLVQGG